MPPQGYKTQMLLHVSGMTLACEMPAAGRDSSSAVRPLLHHCDHILVLEQ